MSNPVPSAHTITIVTQQSLEELARRPNVAKTSETSSSDALANTSSTYAKRVSDYSELNFDPTNTASTSHADGFVVTEDPSIVNSKRYDLQDEPQKFHDSNKGISNAPTTIQSYESLGKIFEPTSMQTFDPETTPAKKTHWYDCFVCCCQARERT